MDTGKLGLTLEQVEALIEIMDFKYARSLSFRANAVAVIDEYDRWHWNPAFSGDFEEDFNNVLFEGGEVWQEDEEDDTNHLENFINEIVEKELNYSEIIQLFNEKKEVVKTMQRINNKRIKR